MEPYIDTSYNENEKIEFSIHALDASTLADIAVATEILRYMLMKRIEFTHFNDIDLDVHNENRAARLEALVRSARNTLKETTDQQQNDY